MRKEGREGEKKNNRGMGDEEKQGKGRVGKGRQGKRTRQERKEGGRKTE